MGVWKRRWGRFVGTLTLCTGVGVVTVRSGCLCRSWVWVYGKDGGDIAGTLTLCRVDHWRLRRGCLCRSWVWVYGKDGGDIAGTLTLCVADRMLKSIY